MYKETITEKGKVIDLENKVNENTYRKECKLFGITFYVHEYTLRWEMPAEEDKPAVGFKTHQP